MLRDVAAVFGFDGAPASVRTPQDVPVARSRWIGGQLRRRLAGRLRALRGRPLPPAPAVGAPPGPALVYVLQPSLQHYRLPVWDLLDEAGGDRYAVHAFGAMADGEALGGGRRPYLHEMEERRVRLPGPTLLRWPSAAALVRRDRPAVVIVAANPRNITCWRLRHTCRRLGVAVVAHAKVDTFTGVPAWAVDGLKRRFYGRFDAIVGYGEHARAKALELGIPGDRITVARNTVDTRRIFDDDASLREQAAALRASTGAARLVVSVGRLEPDKRAADLLAAWPALRTDHDGLHLVLVGGGPDLPSIRQQAAALDADGITVTGRVPDGEDAAWMAAADVCVFPGAVGLALNQALALGVATVIADEDSSDAELVEHALTGWRFPPGDVGSLVAAIDHVLDPAAADEVALVRERGRRLLRDEVTVERMVAVFDAVISGCTARGDARRRRMDP